MDVRWLWGGGVQEQINLNTNQAEYLGRALKPSQMDDELNQDHLNQPQAHLLCPPDNVHMMNVSHFVVVVVAVVVTYSTGQWDVTVL